MFKLERWNRVPLSWLFYIWRIQKIIFFQSLERWLNQLSYRLKLTDNKGNNPIIIDSLIVPYEIQGTIEITQKTAVQAETRAVFSPRPDIQYPTLKNISAIQGGSTRNVATSFFIFVTLRLIFIVDRRQSASQHRPCNGENTILSRLQSSEENWAVECERW